MGSIFISRPAYCPLRLVELSPFSPEVTSVSSRLDDTERHHQCTKKTGGNQLVTVNTTHEPHRRSWVATANGSETDFPIQNLPLGVFSRTSGPRCIGIAIGDQILDLRAAVDTVLSRLAPELTAACRELTLNALMALGPKSSTALRRAVSDLLHDGIDSEVRRQVAECLVAAKDVTLHLPAHVGAFTDFLTSSYHTERGGRHTRPEMPLPVNFKHLPVAYNSRATSVRVSGEAVRRPNGQTRDPDGAISFGPCRHLDFELEVGAFIGPGNALGEPVAIEDAPDHVFGFCLLNDWSARDIQRWESFPLGPFLSKSLSTTISPWVVTAEALAPFRAPAFARPTSDPSPLPYLHGVEDQATGGFDIALEAWLHTPRMRQANQGPVRLTNTNFTNMYWTFAQMVTHHMSNGCNLQPGDLLGSGTASGPTDESRACLAELTERGAEPYDLGNGEQRRFLEDGDEVIFHGRAARDGYVSIGFGECRGTVDPAPVWPTAKRETA